MNCYAAAGGQRELYQIAEGQGGYFTAKQAADLGYTAAKRNYHVGAGNWVREHRGIYRLALFPAPARPDLIRWWLWSRGRSDAPQGVFSHRTALALHDLTDVNPAKLDLTVPPSFRKGSAIPRVLRLHYADVGASEMEVFENVPVTTALRTILDVCREKSLPEPSLREAFEDARRLGKLPARVLECLQDAGTLDLGDFFSFRVGEAMMDLDGAPYGGARHPVEAILGGRTFVRFHIDVGVGDVIVDPVEFVQTRDWWVSPESCHPTCP